MIKELKQLLPLAKGKKGQTLAVVEAQDEPVLQAVMQAKKEGIADVLLFGKKEEIEAILDEMKEDKSLVTIIDARDPDESSMLALKAIREKKATVLMKGLLDTKVLLKHVLNKEYGARKSPLLSHVGLLEFPTLDRLLFVTDGAMNITVSVEQKKDIIHNVLPLCKSLGIKKPKVAIVSAVEKVNPKMQSTVDAEELTNASKNGEFGNALVEGPFAIDNIVSMESVKHKGIKSEVAGKADVLVFPNIESGNVFYKTGVFLAGAKVAGIILGAACPIVLTSRADDAISKLYSISLAVVHSDEN
ncbi:MAG: phosphate butyryltransferase [Treponema sp.]|nr:MAG: phosphate butyryltransferase [Treponema sp.]